MNTATFVKSMKDIILDHHTIEEWHGNAKLWELTDEIEVDTFSGTVTSRFVVTSVDPSGETEDVMLALTTEEGVPLGEAVDFLFGIGAGEILADKGTDEKALADFGVETVA